MTYNETLEFLFSQLPAYHRIGKAAYKNDLDNTRILDVHLGKPHLKFRSVHVAGTNGKGSVSHMIASVLQKAGYKVGLYTSPHLMDFRERIRINGIMIPENEVIGFVDSNKEVIASVKPSFFEMTVAMAFDFFARNSIDIAVVEVGLGGRLDSTNIITPVLSVITNIGHDHMDLLGNTSEAIAREKAGIIKQSVPVVIGELQNEVAKVFIEQASAAGSDIYFADQNFACILNRKISPEGERSYIIRDFLQNRSFKGITPLGGDYQARNLMTVYQAMRALEGTVHCSNEVIAKGIEKVKVNTDLKGRWQILKQEPLTVCDTGHNKEGLQYVINQIERVPKTKLHMVIGFVNDKDLALVLPLFPTDAVYYFTKASVPRALDENILLQKARKYGLRGNSYPDVKTAVQAAETNAYRTDMIFIGGSTFIVADAL